VTEIAEAVPPMPKSEVKFPTNLVAALALAQERGRGVEKDSVNNAFHYNYASSEAIITEAKHALRSTGLSLVPLKPKLQELERQNGGRDYLLLRTFELYHVSGESLPLEITWPVIPGNGRPLDKALAGALTTSLAYLLRDLLLLPRVSEGDDMDHSARDDGGKRPERGERRGPAPDVVKAQGELRAALKQVPEQYRQEGWSALKRAGHDLGRLNALLTWARARAADAQVPARAGEGAEPPPAPSPASSRAPVESPPPARGEEPKRAPLPDWRQFDVEDVRARVCPQGGPHAERIFEELKLEGDSFAESSPVVGALLVLQHTPRAVLNWWRMVGGDFSVKSDGVPRSGDDIVFRKLRVKQLGQLLALAPALGGGS